MSDLLTRLDCIVTRDTKQQMCTNIMVIVIILAPGTRPTNGIFDWIRSSIKFWFKTCSTNHKEILHTSRQLHCCDMCKILLWLAEHVMNKSITKFHWISNFIELSLVGRAPRDQNYHWKLMNSQFFPFIIVFISSDHHETPLTLLNNEFIQTHMPVFMCKYHVWMHASDGYVLSGYCEKTFIGPWEKWPLFLK